MAKQTFVANAILTAAQQNALQNNDFNQTVSTKTVSYTLVAADAGTKIVMNSASATTITVNTSLFAAGDTLTILNIGAGVSTITNGTATVSTTGTLALVQNAGGTLYFTSAGVSVFQANGITATSGAFTAKAYCYFNGTGTPAINSSANISSITDNGVGDYTFNFTTAIGSANYFFAGMGGKAGGGPSAANSSFPMIESPTYATSASLRILYINANGSAFDGESQTIGVFA
jgi:hypothetical protein